MPVLLRYPVNLFYPNVFIEYFAGFALKLQFLLVQRLCLVAAPMGVTFFMTYADAFFNNSMLLPLYFIASHRWEVVSHRREAVDKRRSARLNLLRA
ncbi:hypothetical protein Barb6_00488 [Bacteroidales bacterium Barb6]|nr:hypothetical protein Barb6_00488 [Bacteroidales bacterium Barb6]